MGFDSQKRKPTALHDQALDNLRYIRKTMERAGAFTTVSGMGQVAVGISAILATWVASIQTTPETWMLTWSAESALAFFIATLSTHRKAQAAGESILSWPARKFLMSFAPAMVIGGILTVYLFHTGRVELLPGIWMLHYGAAVVSGGVFSVRVIPIMGASFILAGTLALFAPAAWGNVIMGAGFGGLHVIFGALIARKYGG